MTNRYSRHQSVISREKDAHIDDDYWFKQFEKNLQKSAVQPRKIDDSMFNQINSVINRKSKHTSVGAAVEDMMQRSGLTEYLKNIKVSEQENVKKKVASPISASDVEYLKSVKVLKERPDILNTIKNVISTTKGNLSLPAIIEKIRSIHKSDIAEDKYWEDENLYKLVGNLNLKEKASNSNQSESSELGRSQVGEQLGSNELNSDYFSSLMPAKI